MKKKAFTLTQVLITLSVIGIIAVITIPIAIKNYQKRVLVTQLKEAYSIVLNAIYIARIENPTVSFAGTNHYRRANQLPFNIYVGPHLNIKKDCTGINTACMPVNNYIAPRPGNPNQKTYCLCNGGGAIDTNACYGTRLILKNDIMIYMYNHNKVLIDVNGEKGPNQYNYDLFEFQLDDIKGLIPGSGNTGMGCPIYTKRVLNEGKIDY